MPRFLAYSLFYWVGLLAMILLAGYGVLSTPGLVIDEQVVLAGRVPTVAALSQLLGEAAGR